MADEEKLLSYPKNKIKVLLLENIHQEAARLFSDEGYQVESLSGALSEDELCKRIVDVSILGIRSNTQVTEPVITQAKHLHAIGAFCIGTNQINLESCTSHGIAVFNAPYSNSRSVVELVIGELILLSRRIVDKSSEVHRGIWKKSAKGSHEIRGKKLGIIGYGNIGSQLSVLAVNLGMHVYFYDIADKLALGNAQKCDSMEELLRIADVVTVHVDGRGSNKDLIDDTEFSLMKQGVIFMNLSRGHVVNIEALAAYIAEGKIAGAAVDVFTKEPKNEKELFVSPLQNLPNVISTPHIGGSTEEAQFGIGQFVSTKIITFINTGNTQMSVNFPNLQLPSLENAHRLIHIHNNVPGILAKVNSLLADSGINIVGQYLGTNPEIGYLITDINKQYSAELIQTLKQMPETIRLRVLY